MASPQLENGFARVANELLEQFIVRDFGKRELVILLYVVRQTYGFNRKAFAMVVKNAAEATGLEANNIRASVRALVAAGVLVSNEDGIGLQKNHEAWHVESRERVKITRDTTGQNYPKNGSNLPVERVKITRDTPPIAPFRAVFQNPKDRKTKDNPLTPTGGIIEASTPEPVLTREVITQKALAALEENPPVVLETSAGPDLSRPATPAPKPSQTPQALTEAAKKEADEAEFMAWFDACWEKVLKKVKRKNAVTAARQLPKKHRQAVLDALDAYNVDRDWKKPGELRYYLHFSTFLNGERWPEFLKSEALATVPVRTAAEDAFRAYYIGGKENFTAAQLVDYWVGKINHDLDAALDAESLMAMLATEGLMPTLRQVDRLGREAAERKQVRHA